MFVDVEYFSADTSGEVVPVFVDVKIVSVNADADVVSVLEGMEALKLVLRQSFFMIFAFLFGKNLKNRLL